MQSDKKQRLQELVEMFERELQLQRPSFKRVVKRALEQGYPRSNVNEVIDYLIMTERIPQKTGLVHNLVAA